MAGEPPEPTLLRSEAVQGVVTLTLNRPAKKNALSIELRDSISETLDELAADTDVHCVVLAGSGDVFCAGFDLNEFWVDDPAHQERLWASSDRYHHTVLQFPLPLVAAVNGPALAGGFDLAVCCDVRVASDNARFSHPERVFGEVVYAPLHDLVGAAVASDIVLTGRVLSAAEAHSVGLVRDVVAPDALPEAAAAVAAAIAEVPRDLLRRTKAKIASRRRIDDDAGTLQL